jgi:hypothetical protein
MLKQRWSHFLPTRTPIFRAPESSHFTPSRRIQLKISTEERVLLLMFSMAIGFVVAAAATECVHDGWKQK